MSSETMLNRWRFAGLISTTNYILRLKLPRVDAGSDLAIILVKIRLPAEQRLASATTEHIKMRWFSLDIVVWSG